MTHLEAVRPGAPLVQQVMPRLRSAIRLGLDAPGEHLGEELLSRRFGIGRASLREAMAHGAARQSPNEHRAILSALADLDANRAESLLRQPIARSSARLAAAGSPG